MWTSLLPVLALSSLAHGKPTSKGGYNDTKWSAKKFSSLVTFGDSYTDENRLGYFGSHNGQAPPAGTYLPENLGASSGGRIWARYVIQYTGATVNAVWKPAVTLYNYAVSGAVCSNNLSPRIWGTINAPFPDLDLYEVPAFLADKKFVNSTTGKPYFQPALTADNAVYAIWDGTNDLGADAFFTDSQVRGATLVDYIKCIYTQMDRLYASGARYFVLMNNVPLNLLPMYANDSAGGTGPNKFWQNKPDNHTAIAEKMAEYVALVNNGFKYQTPYEVLVGNRYPGAHVALYDTHQLFYDIYTNPKTYLNGTGTPNVTGFRQHCNLDFSNCTTADNPDSFLWFDELHPAEQADRIVAKEFVNLLDGKSKYATYYG